MWLEGTRKVLPVCGVIVRIGGGGGRNSCQQEVGSGQFFKLTSAAAGAGGYTQIRRSYRVNHNVLCSLLPSSSTTHHQNGQHGASQRQIGQFRQLVRNVSILKLTKNMEVISDTKKPLVLIKNGGGGQNKDKDQTSLKFAVEKTPPHSEQPPLVVMIPWLMSERKHVLKYAQFYLDQGCHIVNVNCSPRQLLFPSLNGGVMVANDLLTFLENNPQYSTKMIHGFSIAAFVWSQTLVLIEKDPVKHRKLIDSFVGQVWDSLVDIEGLSGGVGSAVFPNSPMIRRAVEWYGRFHVDTFQNLATKHYLASRKAYYSTVVKCPALFFCSEDDKVAFHYIVMRIADLWEKAGVKIYMKSWKTSQHILHLQKHPEEYRAEMNAFLKTIGLLKYPDRFPISEAEQQRSSGGARIKAAN